MRYWIIESATRGAFVGFDESPRTGQWRPRFRWSIPLSHEEVTRFYSLEGAQEALEEIGSLPGYSNVAVRELEEKW